MWRGNIMEKGSRKPIDWKQFEQLCALQATQGEIASMLRIDRGTLSRSVEEQYGAPYSAIYTMFSDGGKCSVRRNQLVMSKRNAAMAIWLGKQWLDQKDHQDMYEAPQDANLNYADAFIKAEGEKIKMAKKIEELEAKLNQLMAQTSYPQTQTFIIPPSLQPPYIVTCEAGIDVPTQPQTDSILQ